MSTLMRRAAVGALALLGLLAGHNVARAQFAFGMTPMGLNTNNPLIANRQYLYNLQLGRAAFANSMAVPSPAFAVPFPGPAFNPYAAFGANPMLAGANPYAPVGAAFDPLAAGAGTNPYAPFGASGTGAFDPYSSNPYSPYNWNTSSLGPGYTLMGAADVMRAWGKVITDQESARILREQYYQSKLETKKKAFDLDMYIRNNTPTFTDEMIKNQKQVLKRIQNNSSPPEIVDGRSLNFLIDDVEKQAAKQAAIPPIPLSEGVLRHLNVKPGGLDAQSLGLLRDGGKLSWPSALVDMVSPEVRSDIDARASALAQAAVKGKEPDRNALKDLRISIEGMMAQLTKKANDYGTPEYMEARRFLTDLDNARKAIERGTASAQVAFQQLIAAGKVDTLDRLVDAMVKNGWRFAPALPTDEAAYRAMHSALVAYDIALNQQVATGDEK
jgi:hypothetical protein